jgi:hypothetical protein
MKFTALTVDVTLIRWIIGINYPYSLLDSVTDMISSSVLMSVIKNSATA